jgi:putative transposase
MVKKCLSRMSGKLSCTVLRRGKGSNPFPLVDYTAQTVMEQAAIYGWKQSFSRVGKPGDNAWSESFFSILKKEIVHWRFYPTRELARQAIFEYIEVFYNRVRVQKRLGYKSPLEFLNDWQQRHLPKVA